MINLPKLKLILFICGFLTVNNTPAIAQITPDNTLGAESSRIVPNGSIDKIIDGGALRGSNLFHSFQEFNINNGQSVYFNNPSGIENILTRVTGGNASNILGTLGVDGAANLFLINPNGIIFGENARLDVQGSFVGTTADSIIFENGMEFSATNPKALPLLKISVQSGLQYGKNNPSRTIKNSGNLLVGKNLTLFAGNLDLQGILKASGNITLQATDTVNIWNGIIDTSSEIGNAGDIKIIANSLEMKNGASLFTFSSGIGDGGNVTINARDSVFLDGFNTFATGIYTSLTSEAEGKAGDIFIQTVSLSVTNGAILAADNFGFGNSGKITITASDTVSFDGIGVRSDGETFNTRASASISQASENIKGGVIEINTGSLSITNGASFNNFNLGNGTGGDVKINARDSVFLNNGKIINDAFSLISDSGSVNSSDLINGGSGDIKIQTSSLTLANVSFLSTNTYTNGRAGDIQINAKDFVLVKSGSNINSTTAGAGNAGNIEITAGNTVTFDGAGFLDETLKSFSSANTRVFRDILGLKGTGKGGDIKITTGSLFVTNGAELDTSTTGIGDGADAGNIIIRASDIVSFDGQSNASTSVAATLIETDGSTSQFEVTGDAGDIDIQARSLSVTDGANLLAYTTGAGDAGDIRINATESVIISGIVPATELLLFSGTPFANENIITNTLRSQILSGTGGLGFPGDSTGKGGNINIETGILKLSDGGAISARSLSVAEAGNVNLNVKELELINGGQVFTTARNTGAAGNINVNAIDTISISGFDSRLSIPESGLFANSSSSETTNAGNININAPSVFLDNQGKISTETSSGNGGSINLQLAELLLLRNNSQISTTAGTAQAGGDGGNININSPFIVALPDENSDITANAFTGRGGTVNITTQGIFGIQPRSQTTFQSDITASSQRSIQGEITVTEPEIDPNQGLIELPTGVVDKSDQIAQICPRGINAKKLSEFYITGRGNLPPSPLDMLTGTVELSRLATLDGVNGREVGRAKLETRKQENKKIVEAQGFMKTADGKIYLVAQAPTTTPNATTNKNACVQAAQK